MVNWIERYFYGDPVEQTAEPSEPVEEKAAGGDFNSVLLEIAADQANNISVTHDAALKQSAVLACARVIAEGLAQVPCKVLQAKPNGHREDAVNHPLYDLLLHSPNDWQTSFEFREQVGLHLALTNNAFVFVNRDSRGNPLELYAFEPGCVEVTRHNDYTLTYKVRVKGPRGGSVPISVPPQNMWHLKGLSWDGVTGLDAVKLAREAIGLGLATEKFGSTFFKNSARPSGVLTPDSDKILSPEQVSKLREQWNSQQVGNANAHRTAVLPASLKWQSIASSANEAQWTEARRYQIEEICRFFRVNPVMVMSNANATSYNSIEQLFLAHVTHTLMPWFTRFEQSAFKALLTPAEKKAGYYIKLNEKALLRPDTAQRIAYYREGISAGWLTRNEVREKEDYPRSDDPLADQLTPAANLFGDKQPSTDEAPKNDD